MRSHCYRITFDTFYDRTGIEKQLEQMAARGWMLEKTGTFFWKYRRHTPVPLHYSVVYLPGASDFQPEFTEHQQTFLEFCRHTGWQLAASMGPMQIFYNENESPVPIETDALLELDAIHRAAKKTFLPSYLLLLFSAFLLAALFIGSFRRDPIYALTGSFFQGVNALLLFLLPVAEIGSYYLWRRRALSAARLDGSFLPTKSTRPFQLFILAAIILSLVLQLGYSGEPSLILFLLIWLSVLLLMLFLITSVKKLLKRSKAPTDLNRTVTLALSILLPVIAVSLLTGLILSGLRRGWYRDDSSEEYEYNGHTFTAYHHELPLSVEDLTDTGYDGYSSYLSVSQSPVLALYEAREAPRVGDPAYPQLLYTVTEVRLPFLYDLCLQQQLHRYDEDNKELPAEYQTLYRGTDASSWQANSVWQLYEAGDVPSNTYLVCYPDCILEITASWELTDGQKEKIAEIFR